MTTARSDVSSGSSSTASSDRSLEWLWVTAIALVFFLLLLGGRHLSNPDEGRYTEIPREMAATGDYVSPHLNGVKYFEKPPLLYWLSAATFEVVGVSEWSARLWVAVLAAVGVGVTYAGARRLYNRPVALASAVVLATSLLYYALSRLIILDLVVSVFIASALFSFYAALTYPAGGTRRLLWYGFYASMALATLTKGLIGIVLPGAVAFFWVLFLNQWGKLRPFYPWTGALLLLAIAAPWHVLAAQRNHDFLQFYFVHEHWERFFSNVHDRNQPAWFFAPVLIGGLFPWIAFAPQALREAVKGGWAARKERALEWFLLIWIGLIFLFFSASHSKLIPYILPVFPAAALLIGKKVAEIWSGVSTKGAKGGLWGLSIFAVLLGIALAVYPVPRATPEMNASLLPFRVWLAGVLLVTGLTVSHFAHRNRFRPSLLALVAGISLFLVSLNPLGPLLDTRSTKAISLLLKARLQPSDTVYAVKDYFQDLPVYLDRVVHVVEYEGELSFGIHSEPEKTRDRYIDREEFARRWAQPGVSYAVLNRDDFRTFFVKTPVPFTVVAESRGGILITNQVSK